jgi:hypothetical protein
MLSDEAVTKYLESAEKATSQTQRWDSELNSWNKKNTKTKFDTWKTRGWIVLQVEFQYVDSQFADT